MIVPVSRYQAEVLPRMTIEGRWFTWMNVYSPTIAANIVADEENEIQWDGRIYGYRIFTSEPTRAGIHYELELLERRSVYAQYLIDQAKDIGNKYN